MTHNDSTFTYMEDQNPCWCKFVDMYDGGMKTLEGASALKICHDGTNPIQGMVPTNVKFYETSTQLFVISVNGKLHVAWVCNARTSWRIIASFSVQIGGEPRMALHEFGNPLRYIPPQIRDAALALLSKKEEKPQGNDMQPREYAIFISTFALVTVLATITYFKLWGYFTLSEKFVNGFRTAVVRSACFLGPQAIFQIVTVCMLLTVQHGRNITPNLSWKTHGSMIMKSYAKKSVQYLYISILATILMYLVNIISQKIAGTDVFEPGFGMSETTWFYFGMVTNVMTIVAAQLSRKA